MAKITNYLNIKKLGTLGLKVDEEMSITLAILHNRIDVANFNYKN